MTLKPCVTAGCGELSDRNRCPEHRLKDTRTNRDHVAWRNDIQWKALSKRLRRASPFCEECNTTFDLTTDHIIPVVACPELAYAIENCRVLCRSCNGRRGDRVTLAEALEVVDRLSSTLARRPGPGARKRLRVAQRFAEGLRGAPQERSVRPVGKAKFRSLTRGCEYPTELLKGLGGQNLSLLEAHQHQDVGDVRHPRNQMCKRPRRATRFIDESLHNLLGSNRVVELLKVDVQIGKRVPRGIVLLRCPARLVTHGEIVS